MTDAFDDRLRMLFHRADDHPDGPRLIMAMPGIDLTREQVVRLANHLLAEALLMPRPGEPPEAREAP
jgi:hypothetical protein